MLSILEAYFAGRRELFKGLAGRYAMDSRTVYLIGANFNEKKENRGLEYTIEIMKKDYSYSQ